MDNPGVKNSIDILDVIKKYGIRNTCTVAIPPKEAPSRMIENRASGFEPWTLDMIKVPERRERLFKEVYLRDGVSTIDQLETYKMFAKYEVIRYDFHQMRSIVETNLGYDTRDCGKNIYPESQGDKFDWAEEVGYFKDKDWKSKTLTKEQAKEYDDLVKDSKWIETPYLDYWQWQLGAVFRRSVRNDSTNSIYIGTSEGIDLNKLKAVPNFWQLMILEEWNKTFAHLTDKHGWIKIEMWW